MSSINYYLFYFFLTVPIQQQVVGEIEQQSGSLEHLVPPFRLTESANGTNGFMLVGDSGETESLSYHLRVCLFKKLLYQLNKLPGIL